MKKFIMGLLALAFCMGCVSVTAPVPAPAPATPAPKKYNLTFVNKTDDIALGIVCLAKFPPKEGDKCLFGGVVLFPEKYSLENPDYPCKVTVPVEKGRYIIFILGKDLLTGKELGGTHMVFDALAEDGEFVFRDRRIDVNRSVSCHR